jgi:hypothetical protein
MREGTGLGNPEGGLMAMTSKARFSHLRDDELHAIYAFLQSR